MPAVTRIAVTPYITNSNHNLLRVSGAYLFGQNKTLTAEAGWANTDDGCSPRYGVTDTWGQTLQGKLCHQEASENVLEAGGR